MTKDTKETLGYVHYLDCVERFMGVYMCQNLPN